MDLLITGVIIMFVFQLALTLRASHRRLRTFSAEGRKLPVATAIVIYFLLVLTYCIISVR